MADTAPPSTAVGGRLVPAEASDDGDAKRWLIMAVLAAVAFMAQLDNCPPAVKANRPPARPR